MSTLTTGDIIQAVDRHRVMACQPFQAWAQSRPDVEVLGLVLYQLGIIETSARYPGSMMGWVSMHELPCVRIALEHTTDPDHGTDKRFRRLSYRVLRSADPILAATTPTFDERALLNRLGALAHAKLGPESHGMLPATGALAQVMATRRNSGKAIGVGGMVAISIVTARVAVPGLLRSIIQSGHYDLNLSDPDLVYLRNYTGRGGEAQRNVVLWRQANRELAAQGHSDKLLQGALETCDALANFYDALEAVLRND